MHLFCFKLISFQLYIGQTYIFALFHCICLKDHVYLFVHNLSFITEVYIYENCFLLLEKKNNNKQKSFCNDTRDLSDLGHDFFTFFVATCKVKVKSMYEGGIRVSRESFLIQEKTLKFLVECVVRFVFKKETYIQIRSHVCIISISYIINFVCIIKICVKHAKY